MGLEGDEEGDGRVRGIEGIEARSFQDLMAFGTLLIALLTFIFNNRK